MPDIALLIDSSYSIKDFVPLYVKSINRLLLECWKLQNGNMNDPPLVTIATFDNVLTFYNIGVRIDTFSKIPFNYKVHTGCTSLYDNLSIFISDVCRIHENRKTIIIVITDGIDTSSEKATINTVRQNIDYVSKKYPYLFLYLGTDNTQCNTGRKMGCNYNILYSQSEKSIELAFIQAYNLIRNNTIIDEDVSDDFISRMERLKI